MKRELSAAGAPNVGGAFIRLFLALLIANVFCAMVVEIARAGMTGSLSGPVATDVPPIHSDDVDRSGTTLDGDVLRGLAALFAETAS